MPEEIKTEVLVKEPINVIIETKEKVKDDRNTPAIIELLKWFLGTIVIGGFGIYIQFKNSESEENLRKIDADANLVQTVSAKFDTTARGQLAYLTYIYPFIRTDNFRNAVQTLRDSLTPIVQVQINKTAEKKIDSAVQDNKSSSVTINNATKSEKALDKIKRPKPISELIKQQDTTLPNAVKIDSAAIKSIETQQILLTSRSVKNYILINGPQTLWCKEGYYVEFNNTLRIGISDLNNSKKTITVNFKDIENGAETQIPPSESSNSNKVLNVGENYPLDYNKYRYQITLNYIGAAGKNPFTKAAYITVATYKKP